MQAAVTKALSVFREASPVAATVGKWFRHESLPGLDHCFMLARALGVRPAWLAFGDEPMIEAESTAAQLARRHPAKKATGADVQSATKPHRRTG